MLIVQNRIRVNKGFEDRFERPPGEGREDPVPGRLFVARLKADEPGVYINMSVWESRAAFDAWRQSEAFTRSHADRPPEGAVDGPPQLTIAEVLSSVGSLAPAST
jgi:heme-degrading monooxygenase HmoA